MFTEKEKRKKICFSANSSETRQGHIVVKFKNGKLSFANKIAHWIYKNHKTHYNCYYVELICDMIWYVCIDRSCYLKWGEGGFNKSWYLYQDGSFAKYSRNLSKISWFCITPFRGVPRNNENYFAYEIDQILILLVMGTDICYT